MNLGEAIYAACIGNADLKALVGTRVYPSRAPSDVQGRHIIWQIVSGTLATTLNEAAGSSIVLVQFSAFASSRSDAAAVRDTLIAALDAVTLSNGDRGVLEDIREDYDEGADLYRADADISF